MRPGPARGTTATTEVVVEPSMTDADSATAIDPALPPTFGTLAMADEVARIARTVLDGHLEDDEVVVPGRLEIIHRAPIAVGTTVQLDATVQMVEPDRVTCEVLVRNDGVVAARASYELEVVRRSEWLERLGTVAA